MRVTTSVDPNQVAHLCCLTLSDLDLHWLYLRCNLKNLKMNCGDPDQMALKSCLIRIYTVDRCNKVLCMA